MSLSFDSDHWKDLGFDRRDSLRLSLHALQDALPMARPVTHADMEWYLYQVRVIFEPHLPDGPSSGNISRGRSR